jgi:NADPH:quinone reductase-like Zn-dependent oxidoreductase
VLQLAGTTSPRIARRVLTQRGTLALSSGEGRWSGVDRILAAGILGRFSSQTLRSFLQTEEGIHLAALTAMVESGAVTPLMDRTFALAEAADAIAYQRAGHTRGKSVIVI